MTRSEMKSLAGTLVRVFVAAVLAQFIAGGADVLALTGDGAKTLLASGVSAVAIAAFNYMNPNDSRYGITR